MNEIVQEIARLRRKADQHWEMAGLARQDRDRADEDRHTAKAKEYESMIADAFRANGGKSK